MTEHRTSLQGHSCDEQGTASEMTTSGDGSETDALTDSLVRPFKNKVRERASLRADPHARSKVAVRLTPPRRAL